MKNIWEQQYLDLLKRIQKEGIDTDDRTWVWTKRIFGTQMRFDMSDGFPLLTTKKTFLRGIVVELIWLLRWETNIKYLVDRKVKIWDEWPFQNWLETSWEVDASKYPKYSEEWTALKVDFIEKIRNLDFNDEWVQKWWDLWPVYGHQWRNFWWSIKKWSAQWEAWERDWTDQLALQIENIKNNPTDRRMIVNAWNPNAVPNMLLPPCHMFYQFNVDTTNKKLSLQMYQRSGDIFLWVPFNIASYATLLLLISKITNLDTWDFIHSLWDTHVYSNHQDQVATQLSREPYAFPELILNKDVSTLKDLEDLEWSDFELKNYECHPRIAAPVAV